MPDTPTNPTPPASPPAPAAAPSPPPPAKDATEVANMVAPEYRYPDTDAVPQWARGKTAGDMLQLVQGLVESVGRGAAPAPPPPPPAAPPADDDYVTGSSLRQAQQQAVAQVSPWLEQVAEQQATMSYNIAKREHQDIFKRYEPEIIQVLQAVPRRNWTLDVIGRAVTMVKGNHVDEIAAEKVRALESTMHSTMRSTGRAGPNADSMTHETAEATLEKLPEKWRVHAQQAGITARELHEFCWANDITPDEFFKQFEKGLVTDAIADVNFVRHSTT